MQLQREDLSPEIVKALETVPAEKLAKLLGVPPKPHGQTCSPPSKWAKAAEEMASLEISHEAAEFFRKSVKEFRADEGM